MAVPVGKKCFFLLFIFLVCGILNEVKINGASESVEIPHGGNTNEDFLHRSSSFSSSSFSTSLGEESVDGGKIPPPVDTQKTSNSSPPPPPPFSSLRKCRTESDTFVFRRILQKNEEEDTQKEKTAQEKKEINDEENEEEKNNNEVYFSFALTYTKTCGEGEGNNTQTYDEKNKQNDNKHTLTNTTFSFAFIPYEKQVDKKEEKEEGKKQNIYEEEKKKKVDLTADIIVESFIKEGQKFTTKNLQKYMREKGKVFDAYSFVNDLLSHMHTHLQSVIPPPSPYSSSSSNIKQNTFNMNTAEKEELLIFSAYIVNKFLEEIAFQKDKIDIYEVNEWCNKIVTFEGEEEEKKIKRKTLSADYVGIPPAVVRPLPPIDRKGNVVIVDEGPLPSYDGKKAFRFGKRAYETSYDQLIRATASAVLKRPIYYFLDFYFKPTVAKMTNFIIKLLRKNKEYYKYKHILPQFERWYTKFINDIIKFNKGFKLLYTQIKEKEKKGIKKQFIIAAKKAYENMPFIVTEKNKHILLREILREFAQAFLYTYAETHHVHDIIQTYDKICNEENYSKWLREERGCTHTHRYTLIVIHAVKNYYY